MPDGSTQSRTEVVAQFEGLTVERHGFSRAERTTMESGFSPGLPRLRETHGFSASRREESYITGGTLIPMTVSTPTSSRRTIAAVASRNRFRPSSASVRM